MGTARRRLREQVILTDEACLPALARRMEGKPETIAEGEDGILGSEWAWR
ncbi:MAG: hypothetical protein ACM34A_03220 [Bacillota bacterium]